MNALWKGLDTACFGHLRPMSEPHPTRGDLAEAEQFTDDAESIATDLLSELSRYGAKVRNGERGAPEINIRGAFLVELGRLAAMAKQMREGAI